MEANGVKIVVIGGGTGSFALLSGLKHYTNSLVALVSMADDGGSTGQLRDELGVLPPGDARQCLVALSHSPKVRELFNYRFSEGTLRGHTMGNLFLTALEKLTGSFAEAIETAAEVLRVEGRVIPATLDNVRLKMRWPEENYELSGEHIIDEERFAHDPRRARLSLEPAAKANPAALEAIAVADLVVLAPGDLYTSLGSALAANGFHDALTTTRAKVIYVCNLVTKRGQTDGFDVIDHAAEIERLAGGPVLDVVLYNHATPSPELLEKYATHGEFWVEASTDTLALQHYEAVAGDFLAQAAATPGKGDALQRNLIRHDSDKVARALMRLYF